MGFDTNNPGEPLVHTERKTTKVNFTIVFGVLLFLVAGALSVWWVMAEQPDAPTQVTPVP